MIELVKRLDVRYDGIRIGAVIYSNFAENKIFMNTEFDKNLLLQVSAMLLTTSATKTPYVDVKIFVLFIYTDNVSRVEPGWTRH